MLDIQKLAASRPSANHLIEQFLMKPEILEQQAEHVGPFLANKRVFFLGDDDHMSPILAAKFNVEPVVYEVDSRVRDNLVVWFGRLGVFGEVVEYDAQFPIGLALSHEAFYINPPYSSKSKGLGIKVWLMRALEACEPTAKGVLVMPWDGGNINEAWVQDSQDSVMDFIEGNGCKILKIDHNTASYFGTTQIGLMSSNVYIQRADTSKQQAIDIAGLYN